jgi:hypothetical protein
MEIRKSKYYLFSDSLSSKKHTEFLNEIIFYFVQLTYKTYVALNYQTIFSDIENTFEIKTLKNDSKEQY